ncbi:NHLM bacteriocin system ABC transporter, peptidase/ATP-binding protein [Butyrivibrio proteoclasticus]|uniref:NHLM bacteriocin system ABC transporter, peptidase/ATP-binding protein n=1 Tax=Butyrivibrio proteoclasticus TaxID=43305 RepID=A0A1I5XBH5_9FIRM|nr:NHLP family bacteriocin export ABC transporter peptidase/permease/ATPase subunit [Butyrivibrio proteoclasticus]SFQ29291.1 NHLM bacteriocin system ABC transporter, peptidase/ATP-binding protein [Butyrivibrio proteoclasticus]
MGSSKISPPLNKGVAKVPLIMQLEALECGAASLAMLMAYYGKWLPLEQVRSDCGVSRDGSNAKNIYLAAQNYGFDVKAFRKSPEKLRDNGTFPCIIHWNMNHFVVLDGFKGKKVYLNDPARGRVTVSWEEFDRAFTGVCIIPVPGEKFKPEGKPKSTLSFARKRLIGAGGAVAFVMVTTMLSYLFGIVNSVTSRIFMDRLLTGINRDWLYPFISIMVFLAVLQLVVAWAQAVYSLKINGKMAAIGSCSYMWKVLRLPMEFYSQRYAGDIQARLTLNESIAGTLVNTFAPLLLNSAMMVFYLVLMLRKSPLLTIVGLTALFFNIIVSRIISDKRMNIARVSMRDMGKLEATTVSCFQMIETIKASGAENGFFGKWAGYQASANQQDVCAQKMDQFWGIIPAFVSTAANYIVLLLGVYLVMQGDFTLGGVLLFQGLLTAFMSPAMMLVNAGQTIQEMRSQMERVEDVMEYPDDPALIENAKAGEISKLEGNVELKNITFGYSKLAEPLIKNFSISIKSGERIAIVGPSGCGKSTLSKLISGLYQPWSGEVLFDGKGRSEYPRDVITGSVAVVDQDIILFEGTIADNIRMWDESIEESDIIMAAHDAHLHEDIMKMPGGYRRKLTDHGRDLSGGQRQRMEIARVLAQDPTIIILDEATSALDAKTEYDVVRAIKDRGITCIVIAHRLSTVRDCDKILVLDHGEMVECGTHDELIQKNGAYAELVANE